jgi:preprotein translocase subunit SecA
MFGQLLEVIDNDYLRYILHVEAVQPAASEEPDLDRAVYVAADDPVAETSALAGVLAAEAGAQVAPQLPVLTTPDGHGQATNGFADGNGDGGGGGGGGRQRGAKAQVRRPNAPDPDALRPVVKEQHEKIGRNEPCWCGSGKKFKFCHGAA